jgi:hypothetical protein
MKIKINPIALSVLLAVSLFLYLQSCKNDEAPVTPPETNTEAQIPVLLLPANNSTSQTFTPVLDWEDYSNAQSYRLQVSLDANFAGTMIFDSSGITVSQYAVPSGLLTTNNYYYWRVTASGSFGTTGWSKVFRFNIILTAPNAPTLNSPANGSTNESFTPFMDWNSSTGADFYRIQISSFSSFNSIDLDSGRIINTEMTVPQFILNSGTTYFWRVNASNSNGASTSQWSPVFNFSTVSGPPPNSISGTIIFVDSSFAAAGASYYLGLYTSWPPVGVPSLADTLDILHVNGLYQATYRIKRLNNGTYYPVTLTTSGLFLTPPILGIYGCDTVHLQYSNCPSNPTGVTISNNFGHQNVNFLSWADTTKRIY